MKNGFKIFGLFVVGLVLFYMAQILFSEIEPFKLRFSISLVVYVSYVIGVLIGAFLKIKM